MIFTFFRFKILFAKLITNNYITFPLLIKFRLERHCEIFEKSEDFPEILLRLFENINFVQKTKCEILLVKLITNIFHNIFTTYKK